jgi:VCBS repeat-containing protein
MITYSVLVSPNPVNDDTVTPPTVPALNLDVTAGASLSANAAHGVLAGATDPAPLQPLSVVAVNGIGTEVGHAVAGAYGTLTLNADGSYNYTATASSAALPDGGAEDNFTFTVSDINGNTTTATFSILVASAGDTTFVGTAGGTVNAGNGNSVIDGRAGNERINAGNGADVVAAGPNDVITVGNGQDVVTGGANDTIQAGNGPDSISTGANSHVMVGNGPDTVAVGDGSTVALGNGQDTVTAGANASVSGGNGQDSVTAGMNAKITLGNGNDMVTAGPGSTISLGNGNNTVTPGAGSTVTLGNGNNTVFGDADDIISVGNGQNQLIASPGDVWTVGNGQDVFTFNAGFGNNTITDFNTSHDVLQFNNLALLTNYAAAIADSKQVGANAVVTYDASDTITLDNVMASHLTASNFKFT